MFMKTIVYGPMSRKCDVSLTTIQGMIGWSHKTLTMFMKPLDDYIKGCSDMAGESRLERTSCVSNKGLATRATRRLSHVCEVHEASEK